MNLSKTAFFEVIYCRVLLSDNTQKGKDQNEMVNMKKVSRKVFKKEFVNKNIVPWKSFENKRFKNKTSRLQTSGVLLFFAIAIFLPSCSHLPFLRGPQPKANWRIETWELLGSEIKEEREGIFKDKGFFGELDLQIIEKIEIPPVFAGAIKNGATDELYLLSPRDTMIRKSSWDGTFRWNWAVGGSSYVFHLFKDGKEILNVPRESKRTIYLKEKIDFSPGVVYTWDITCCVAICNLPLSSNAFDRPEFSFLTPNEEKYVKGDIDTISQWCKSKGIYDSPAGIALRALILEKHKLYIEELDLLVDGIKKYPNSALLHLVLSSVYDQTDSPAKAAEEYEKAEKLLYKIVN